jgi:hypothetical protein
MVTLSYEIKSEMPDVAFGKPTCRLIMVAAG